MDKIQEICDKYKAKFKIDSYIEDLESKIRIEKLNIEFCKSSREWWSFGCFIQIPSLIFPFNKYFLISAFVFISVFLILITIEGIKIRDIKDNIASIEEELKIAKKDMEALQNG